MSTLLPCAPYPKPEELGPCPVGSLYLVRAAGLHEVGRKRKEGGGKREEGGGGVKMDRGQGLAFEPQPKGNGGN